MTSELLIPDDEIAALSGYKRPSKQIAWLREWGIPHFVAGDGHPRVLRSALEKPNLSGRLERPNLEGLSTLGRKTDG